MPDPGTTDPGASPQAGTALLELIRRLARELRPGVPVPELSLDSALDAEAGIDSLGRMELFARLERVLGWHLDEDRAIAANTPRELLAAVAGTSPPAAPAPSSPRITPAAPAHRIPARIATLTEALAWHAEHHPER
ncbi:MAG TPA: acyl carrier protein, partial [Chromatiales bacterium]|nr:acyl carrier protein [Chromatiales bacterium]